MNQDLAFQTSEMKRVIGAVADEFYTQAAPAGIAGRLARLHQAAWDDVVAGREAGPGFDELRRNAARLFNADDLIANCNRHIVWALTPVVAASLACEPGEGHVSLRDVGAAILRMLAAASGAGPDCDAEPRHRAAA